MDTYLLFDLMRPPLFKMAHPTVAEAKARRDATTDGSMPLEPYQIISQYTLEPLLKSVAETIPSIAVKFGHEFISFTEQADGVTAQIRKTNGEHTTIRARYMVGCDGGSSAVRRQLGYKMEGEPNILESMTRHIDNLAGDTALMEILGPSPDSEFRQLTKRAADAGTRG